MRRRDDARFGALGLLRAHRLVFAILQDPQELALEFQRRVADLVEKDRSRAGQREAAAPVGGRAGKRTSDVAE